MRLQDSHLLLINSTCSAGCRHCPFGKKKDGKHFELHEVFSQDVDLKDAKLLILSGGEPLEHPNLNQFIEHCNRLYLPFRIATGGHSPILQHLHQLNESKHFTGFSIGTDLIINERNNNQELRSIWSSNIATLNRLNKKYSITITLCNSLDLEELILKLLEYQANPSFFLLNEMENIPVSQHSMESAIETLKFNFPKTLIKIGFNNV